MICHTVPSTSAIDTSAPRTVESSPLRLAAPEEPAKNSKTQGWLSCGDTLNGKWALAVTNARIALCNTGPAAVRISAKLEAQRGFHAMFPAK